MVGPPIAASNLRGHPRDNHDQKSLLLAEKDVQDAGHLQVVFVRLAGFGFLAAWSAFVVFVGGGAFGVLFLRVFPNGTIERLLVLAANSLPLVGFASTCFDLDVLNLNLRGGRKLG